MKLKDAYSVYLYYIIIGVISFISVTFLPMLGSTVGLAWDIPNTLVGWIVWITVKLIVAALNVLIFHCFMKQGKLNVKCDPRFIVAETILNEYKLEQYNPRSPKQYLKKQYGSKGVSIFITTALATVALTQALLQYNTVLLLTYLFTIVMGLIFGFLQMKNAEAYWTEEYYDYAVKIKKEKEKEREKAKC